VVAPVCGGVWRGLFGRNLKSGFRSCVGVFGRNLASFASEMFSHLIYFITKFYEGCTFNAICKDNVKINCIPFNTETFTPVNFDGPYCVSAVIIYQ
jgi:hypothetical protein